MISPANKKKDTVKISIPKDQYDRYGTVKITVNKENDKDYKNMDFLCDPYKTDNIKERKSISLGTGRDR